MFGLSGRPVYSPCSTLARATLDFNALPVYFSDDRKGYAEKEALRPGADYLRGAIP